MIAIDPGKCSGWAFFSHDRLQAAGVMSEDEILDRPPMVDLAPAIVVIELPVVYPMGKGKGDSNDLITLALLVGELRGFYRRLGLPVELVRPRTWKGTVPKAIHNDRVLAALTARERDILPKLSKTKTHNMVDAIGLGLWKIKRT